MLFFFNDTATTEIYTLSLHDALPICADPWSSRASTCFGIRLSASSYSTVRSEEHTSALQSPDHLVCRLLLAKKTALMRLRRSRFTTASRRRLRTVSALSAPISDCPLS